PERQHKLVVASPKVQLKTFVNVETKTPETNGNSFSLTIGSAFRSLNAEETLSAPPYCFVLNLAPVAFVGLASGQDSACWFDGDLLIRSNATLLLKLNARTGQLLELSGKGEEKGSATRFQARFERGAFERAAKRIEQ